MKLKPLGEWDDQLSPLDRGVQEEHLLKYLLSRLKLLDGIQRVLRMQLEGIPNKIA